MSRPSWVSGHLRAGRPLQIPNVVSRQGRPLGLAEVGPELSRSAVVWEDLLWLRQAWTGPLLVKGILGGEDAERAVELGVDGIIVSNHGGRQLDRVAATLTALPEVLHAVGGRIEVLVDGGVRRGADAVIACCIGARAVLVGRAYAYGLAADGERGVGRALTLLRDGVDRTLALLGCGAVVGLGPEHIRRRGGVLREETTRSDAGAGG